jgi:hypothetical protein
MTAVRAFVSAGGAADNTLVNNGDGTYTVANGSTIRFIYGPSTNLTNKYVVITVDYISGNTAASGLDWTDDVRSLTTKTVVVGNSYSFYGVHSLTAGEGSFVDIQNASGASMRWRVPTVREFAGNHAAQPASAQRPIYGVIPYGGVRNFAIGSGDVGNATYWPSNTVNGVTVTRIASGIDVDGLPYNDWTVSGTCTATSAINMYLRSQSRLPAIVGSVWTSSVIVKRIAGSAQPFNCGVRAEAYGETAPSTTSEAYNGNLVDSTTETISTVTATLANAATNQAAATVSFRSEIGATLNATYRIKALQFEKGSLRTAFQLSMSKYNTTEAGKATVGALFADGIDDGMVTPSIDFSGTDKVTVWAGVEKLSDAAQAVLLELSANSGTTPNSFSLQAPGPGVSFRLVSAGSATGSGIADATGFPAPTARVLTGIGDISGDRATLQVNGSQVAQSTADQGAGNYGNYPVYLFRRGGTTLPFNGIFTGLIARGAQSSAAQLADGNTYINSTLGAY